MLPLVESQPIADVAVCMVIVGSSTSASHRVIERVRSISGLAGSFQSKA